MTLIRTSLLNGIAVIIKMLTLLGINKVLAIYVGPAGYAALGQFQNAVQMITTFASGAINTGVTKYTAEYYEDETKQRKVWRTAGTIAFIGSLLTSILIAVFNQQLAALLLKNVRYGSVFLWFAATLVFFIFNSLLLAILNGKKEVKRYVLINIIGSIFSLVVTVGMVIQFGLYGALVSMAIYQSLNFIITLFMCYRLSWFKISYFYGGIDKQASLNLAKFTAMALTSAACVPVSQILIRNHLGQTFGWDAAGYWEAMWRLSNAYLLVVTTTLSIYYLPRLSEIKESHDLKNEIIQGYKIILPVAAICGLIIYVLRDFLISILFTKDFAPMRELFAWQMIGDTLKIGSWLLGYVLAARAFTGLYIFSEILFSLSFYIAVCLLSPFFGLKSVVIAFAGNYALHLMFMYFSLRAKGIFK